LPSASLQPSAQTPPPKCPLTGITLIPGAKSEKGFFSLLAIKASCVRQVLQKWIGGKRVW
jgi:hypothetical protein